MRFSLSTSTSAWLMAAWMFLRSMFASPSSRLRTWSSLVERAEFLVRGLQLLVDRLQFLVRGLQLLRRGHHLLVHGLEFFVGGLQLLDRRLQRLPSGIEFDLEADGIERIRIGHDAGQHRFGRFGEAHDLIGAEAARRRADRDLHRRAAVTQIDRLPVDGRPRDAGGASSLRTSGSSGAAPDRPPTCRWLPAEMAEAGDIAEHLNQISTFVHHDRRRRQRAEDGLAQDLMVIGLFGMAKRPHRDGGGCAGRTAGSRNVQRLGAALIDPPLRVDRQEGIGQVADTLRGAQHRKPSRPERIVNRAQDGVLQLVLEDNTLRRRRDPSAGRAGRPPGCDGEDDAVLHLLRHRHGRPGTLGEGRAQVDRQSLGRHRGVEPRRANSSAASSRSVAKTLIRSERGPESPTRAPAPRRPCRPLRRWRSPAPTRGWVGPAPCRPPRPTCRPRSSPRASHTCGSR